MVPAPLGFPPVFYRPESVVGKQLRHYAIVNNLIQQNVNLLKGFRDYVAEDWTSWLGISQYASKWEAVVERDSDESEQWAQSIGATFSS